MTRLLRGLDLVVVLLGKALVPEELGVNLRAPRFNTLGQERKMDDEAYALEGRETLLGRLLDAVAVSLTV